MSHPNRARRAICQGVLFSSMCLFLTACGSNWQNYNEEFVHAGITNPQSQAPAWVTGKVQEDNANIYFVGRSIAYDVLDERGGFDGARDHVLDQIGRAISTHVSSTSDLRNARWNPRYLPGEKADQSQDEHMRLAANAIAGDLVERSTYWEQWYLEEKPENYAGWPFNPARQRIKRYKCWVLMSIPRDKFEQRIAETQNHMAVEAAAPGKIYRVTGG